MDKKTLNSSILSSKKHRQYESNKVNSTATKYKTLALSGNGVYLTLTRPQATQFCRIWIWIWIWIIIVNLLTDISAMECARLRA